MSREEERGFLVETSGCAGFETSFDSKSIDVRRIFSGIINTNSCQKKKKDSQASFTTNIAFDLISIRKVSSIHVEGSRINSKIKFKNHGRKLIKTSGVHLLVVPFFPLAWSRSGPGKERRERERKKEMGDEGETEKARRLFIRLWGKPIPRSRAISEVQNHRVALDLWIGRREAIEFRAQSRSLSSLSDRVSPDGLILTIPLAPKLQAGRLAIDYRRQRPTAPCLIRGLFIIQAVPDARSCRPLADTLPPEIVLMDCLGVLLLLARST